MKCGEISLWNLRQMLRDPELRSLADWHTLQVLEMKCIGNLRSSLTYQEFVNIVRTIFIVYVKLSNHHRRLYDAMCLAIKIRWKKTKSLTDVKTMDRLRKLKQHGHARFSHEILTLRSAPHHTVMKCPKRCEIFTDGQHSCSTELFEKLTFNVTQVLYKDEHKILFLIFGATHRKA